MGVGCNIVNNKLIITQVVQFERGTFFLIHHTPCSTGCIAQCWKLMIFQASFIENIPHFSNRVLNWNCQPTAKFRKGFSCRCRLSIAVACFYFAINRPQVLTLFSFVRIKPSMPLLLRYLNFVDISLPKSIFLKAFDGYMLIRKWLSTPLQIFTLCMLNFEVISISITDSDDNSQGTFHA